MTLEGEIRTLEKKLFAADNIEASLWLAIELFDGMLHSTMILTKRDRARIHDDRGFAFYKLGHFEAALMELDKALELNPKSTAAYVSRAAIYNETGRFERSLAELEMAEKASSRTKDKPNIYAHRGDAMRCLGREEEAIENYRLALELVGKKHRVYVTTTDYLGAIRAQKGLSLMGIEPANLGIKRDYIQEAAIYGMLPQQQIDRIKPVNPAVSQINS